MDDHDPLQQREDAMEQPDRTHTAAIRPRSPGTAPVSPRLVEMSGPSRGASHLLQPGSVLVGREPDNDVVLDDPALSRHHCKLVVDAEGRATVMDMHSTNGTYVNGGQIRPDQTVEVEPGALIEIGNQVLKYLREDDAEAVYHTSMYDLAHRDSLTGLYTRAYLYEFLSHEIARVRRDGLTVSFVLVDVDHFKDVNDSFGHLAGDEVLRRLGEHLQERVRLGDCAARYGGEELAVVLHNAPRVAAHALAEDLRRAIAAMRCDVGGRSVQITASFGVAELAEGMAGVEDLVDAADARLYTAKQAGRNRVAS